MGKCAFLFLLLPQYLLIDLLQLGKSTILLAAAQNDYVVSFTPQDTPHFWSSQPGGHFTFGFKLVDGGEYLLAIWHSLDASQTAIWWADFGYANSTNTVKNDTTFNYTSSGGLLQLFDSASSLVWQSSTMSNNTSSTSLQFLDTGNLKLLEANNTANVVWATFQDWRDSMMLTDLNASLLMNNPLVLRSRRDQTSYVRGKYHMATYDGLHINLFGLDQLNKQYVYMDDTNVSLSISGDVVKVGNQILSAKYIFTSSNSSLWRLSLDYDANLRVYQWASKNLTWLIVWELLTDSTLKCRAQSPCGPFGLCIRDSGNIRCSCPSGYALISPNDPTRGCNSTRMPPICGQGNTTNNTVMEEIQHGDFYYNDLNSYSRTIYDLEVCKNACLSNCACIAATFHTDSFKCFLKGNRTMGYLENGYIEASHKTILLIKLLQLPDATQEGPLPQPGKKSRHLVLIIVVSVTLATLALIACTATIWWWRRRTGWPSCYGRKQGDEGLDAGPMRFRYKELVEATKNFSDLLGEGAFGAVYRGQITGRGGEIGSSSSEPRNLMVAVKVLKQVGSGPRGVDKTMLQFRAEAGTLSKIHHVNLVSLLGYCIGGPHGQKRRLLVYEYMVKGSLDRYLSPKHMSEPLPWSLRYSIAVGTARGIAYLHHDCNPRILHCDIKPHNVLLDEQFMPKVADFGLASYLGKIDQSHLIMPGIRGTLGYMAPEWFKNDAITPTADVYSFGLLLLELVHGLNSGKNMPLRDWASQCITAGSIIPDHEIMNVGDAVDERSHDEVVAHEGHTSDETLQSAHMSTEQGKRSDVMQQLHCLRVALWCVNPVAIQRPAMSEVVKQLEGMCDIPDPTDLVATDNSTTGQLLGSTFASNIEPLFSLFSGR